MTKTIEDLFIYLAVYTAIIPIFLFLIKIKKTSKNLLLILVTTYSAIEFITNKLSEYSVAVTKNNLPTLYACFTIIEYSLFASFCYVLIQNPRIKKLIIFLSLAYVTFAIIYFISFKFKFLDSIPIGIETLIIIAYSFYYLYEEMEAPSDVLIYNKPSFWVISAIMIYLAGSFFIYIFANQVDRKTLHEYWLFTNVFTILKNIFFSTAILISLKKPKPIIKTYSFPQ